MDWQNQLIDVYLTTCDFFSQLPSHTFLKISPNSGHGFSDAEAITVYTFGIMENLRNVKSIHSYFKKHLQEWFPALPEYEGFLARINALNKILPEFCAYMLEDKKFSVDKSHPNYLAIVDSLPIVMAKGYRAHKCKIASDFANMGYCASKKLFYYGVKLHVLAENQQGTLPSPKIVKMTPANVHDLTAMKEHFFELYKIKVLGDKAYCDKKMKEKLLEEGIEIHTPIKFSRSKKELDENEKLYSKIISSFRQSIEIYFGWLIEKSGIQSASKVRSIRGLLVHVFGRFSACLFKYKFSF